MFFRRRAAVCGASRLITTKRRNHGVLQSALNTQVITDTIVPLRTQDDNAQLKSAMDHARTHLEFAQALGYGTKNDFDKFYQQLNEIEEKTANNKFGTGLFAKIKESIADPLKSTQSGPPTKR
jgi:hypothetical protein